MIAFIMSCLPLIRYTGRKKVRRNGPANEIGHPSVFLRLMKCTLQSKHKHWLTNLLLVAAQRFHVEALPVLDAALHVYLTLPGHTSTREDEGQPVVEGVMRLPVP
jgi:hypothetical protein